jgi:hypothetical protein
MGDGGRPAMERPRGDSELNPGALPPAVDPTWASQPTHDLVTAWALQVGTAWFAPSVRVYAG